MAALWQKHWSPVGDFMFWINGFLLSGRVLSSHRRLYLWRSDADLNVGGALTQGQSVCRQRQMNVRLWCHQAAAWGMLPHLTPERHLCVGLSAALIHHKRQTFSETIYDDWISARAGRFFKLFWNILIDWTEEPADQSENSWFDFSFSCKKQTWVSSYQLISNMLFLLRMNEVTTQQISVNNVWIEPTKLHIDRILHLHFVCLSPP